jgi:hypothetical protein
MRKAAMEHNKMEQITQQLVDKYRKILKVPVQMEYCLLLLMYVYKIGSQSTNR